VSEIAFQVGFVKNLVKIALKAPKLVQSSKKMKSKVTKLEKLVSKSIFMMMKTKILKCVFKL